MNIENLITSDSVQTNRKYQVLENGTIPIHRIKKDEKKTVRIRQSEFAKKMAEGFYDNKTNENLVKLKPEFMAGDESKLKKEKSKKDKKHKKHKKDKKLKKKQKKKVNAYAEQLDTSARKANIGKLLSMILANSVEVRVVKNSVYIYDEKTGAFKLSDKQEITTKINSWLEKEREDACKFTSRDTDEAYKYLITDSSIQRESMEAAYNKPYVLCENGVLSLSPMKGEMKLLPFSPEYEFTFGINASYDENAQGKLFKEFIEYTTNGDKEIKHLVQEILGYAISNYCNKRLAFIFKGDRGTGKSTILDVARQLVGEDATCEVPLNLLEQEYYAAKVLSVRLNIVPDHNTLPIKDVSKFKSFVSDSDVVSGRNPTERPFAKRCRTKFLIAQNEFFRFSGVGQNDLEAFFDRILYVPYNIKIEKRIDGFWEKLLPERDYIFTWAMKGLKRLIENDFQFTKCEASEKMKMEAMTLCNPEETFLKNCLKSVEDDRYESSSAITEAFRYFCNKNKIEGNFNITNYLEKNNIPKLRKRINDSGYISSEGNPIYVFEGLRLRAKYRVS